MQPHLLPLLPLEWSIFHAGPPLQIEMLYEALPALNDRKLFEVRIRKLLPNIEADDLEVGFRQLLLPGPKVIQLTLSKIITTREDVATLLRY